MSIASDLLERHLQTLVADPAQWQKLIADDIVWELAYAPALGHPARLTGRDEVIRHVAWFLGAVEGFRFIEPRLSAFADPLAAVVPIVFGMRFDCGRRWGGSAAGDWGTGSLTAVGERRECVARDFERSIDAHGRGFALRVLD